MKLKKSLTFGVVTLSSVTASAACGDDGASDSLSASGGGKASGEQALCVTGQQGMPTADLSLATDRISSITLDNVHEGIYRLDRDNKVQPADAAEKAEVSRDGLAYKVKLNKNAKRSGGKPVTANDYVCRWQRAVNLMATSEYAYLYASVKSGNAIAKGEKDKSGLGIKAVSDIELEITLEKTAPCFDCLLIFPSFFPRHQDIAEKYDRNYASNSESAAHNGPLVLDGLDDPDTNTKWSFKENGQYWDKDTVKLDSVDVDVVKESSTALNSFRGGQADDVVLSGKLAQQMANDPASVNQEKASAQYMESNQHGEKSPFRDTNLRKTISHSIDRKASVESTLGDGSIESNGLVSVDMAKDPSGGKDFAKEANSQIEHDTKKVKEYQEKVKRELGASALTVNILSLDAGSLRRTVESAQGSIQDTLDGVKVTVSSVPFSVRLNRSNKGDLGAVIGGWSADYADPNSFLGLFASDSSYNRGRYNNPEFDRFVKVVSSVDATDPKKHWDDMLNAERTTIGDMGVVPLFQESEAHLRAEKVRDAAVHPAGTTYDYKWAYISE